MLASALPIPVVAMTLTAVVAIIFGRDEAVRLPSFLAAVCGAVIIAELLSSLVFFGYERTQRDARYLLLAAAYCCSGCIAVPYLLTFPGIISSSGLFGATEQTAPYLWVCWHALFPALILVAVLAPSPWRMKTGLQSLALASAVIAIAIAIAAATTWLLTIQADALPNLRSHDVFLDDVARIVAPVICALDALALAALLRNPQRYPGMTAWLAISLIASALDTVVGVLSARYSYGWYAGKIFSVISPTAILVAYFIEMFDLQSNLSNKTTELRLENEAEREGTQERLRYLAHHDEMTGLVNRTHWRTLLAARIDEHSGGRSSGAVLLVNLDSFRNVNETLGEACGDAILREVSRRLTRAVGDECVVGRLCGDEFAVLVPDDIGVEQLEGVTHRILLAISGAYFVSEMEIELTGSIGLARYPADGRTTEAIMQHADIAMFHAKRAGSNRVRHYSVWMGEELERNRILKEALVRALRRGDFAMYYQPLVDLRTGRMQGVEALVRWIDPERGVISPATFIPLAEEIGLMEAIGRWTVEAVIAQAREWNALGNPLNVAINVSAKQLQDPGFFEHLFEALAGGEVLPCQLELEVTESAAMKDSDKIINLLGRCRRRGMKIALDDYGTYYSSLTYLQRLPIDTIKVDRSFVKDIPESESDAAIIRSVIALGHDLGKTIVAEGIETVAQLKWLRWSSCDIGQGYLFARPMPADEILEWRRAQAGRAVVLQTSGSTPLSYAG